MVFHLSLLGALLYLFDDFIIAPYSVNVKGFSKLFLLGEWKVERAHETLFYRLSGTPFLSSS
jgi:hypothetical protein